MTALAPLPLVGPRRLVYLATPEIAVAPLEALVEAGFDVALVVTTVDKRRGRGSAVAPSPVKAAAERLSLRVSHRVEDALDVDADLGVVVAFGQLIRPPVLVRLPMVNLHFSLLPRWRGAAPVERAILAGDAVTGVCLMQVDVGLDTGPVIDVVETPIGSGETAVALRRRLALLGMDLLVRNLTAGLGPAVAQIGEASHAAKISGADRAIVWHDSAESIGRLVRVGGAWTTFRGKRLKVLEAIVTEHAGPVGTFIDTTIVATGEAAVRLVTVQPEGKAAMDAAVWAIGARPQTGERIGAATATSTEMSFGATSGESTGGAVGTTP
ncbi:MAG: methionyl-tRNA formyltransferase [Ilumatobacteraceae bacterium]